MICTIFHWYRDSRLFGTYLKKDHPTSNKSQIPKYIQSVEVQANICCPLKTTLEKCDIMQYCLVHCVIHKRIKYICLLSVT